MTAAQMIDPHAALSAAVALDEMADDLVSFDADPLTGELDQAHRDGLASLLMRRQAEALAALTQEKQSRDLEVRMIAHRYEVAITRHVERIAQLEAAVQALAWQTKEANAYTGKKKSRDVGAGTYGYRSYAAAVTCTDEAAYIAWAEGHAPETLRVKVTMPLAEAREYLTRDELASVRREVIKADVAALIATDRAALPPGWVEVPAHDEFYAKPLPAAAIAGARI